MWVTSAEMRPGDPAVLHHGKVWVRPPGSTWMEKAVPGEAYEVETQRDILGKNSIEEGNDILGKFNPGLGAQRFDQEGAAKFIPKGSDLIFELHYTTSGKPASDVSKVGFVLAKNPPQTRYYFHDDERSERADEAGSHGVFANVAHQLSSVRRHWVVGRQVAWAECAAVDPHHPVDCQCAPHR